MYAKKKTRTNKIMYPRIHRNPQLRAHPIRPADEHRIDIARRLEVEHTAETTDLGVRA